MGRYIVGEVVVRLWTSCAATSVTDRLLDRGHPFRRFRQPDKKSFASRMWCATDVRGRSSYHCKCWPGPRQKAPAPPGAEGSRTIQNGVPCLRRYSHRRAIMTAKDIPKQQRGIACGSVAYQSTGRKSKYATRNMTAIICDRHTTAN